MSFRVCFFIFVNNICNLFAFFRSHYGSHYVVFLINKLILFQAWNVSKASLEKQFSINAEREGYYKSVETEIEVPSGGEGKRKSVLADLKAKKAEAAKQPRKKGVIDKDKSR